MSQLHSTAHSPSWAMLNRLVPGSPADDRQDPFRVVAGPPADRVDFCIPCNRSS
ncbi:hypothetical protein NLX86_05340 [Streptomyces sp. A3M-1-3]|uniref:hypothetical protein n=1 Tax=Streptomyces sp. A3M-1-3 TaxID=2962044 RepID=UPI0020B8C730|nr:hypothetical protein [Streptomyces sp. A3M-1-3]MCP3817579.1 hypothetical protein [Streptomyces sp. A3M-1-3]